nr:sperm acrosome membrane-associated protein 6 isoform X3 [Manis javanica]
MDAGGPREGQEGATIPRPLLCLHSSWLPEPDRAPAWACLFCFTSHEERLRICQIFTGMEGPELETCEKEFTAAFEGLKDVQINYSERGHLHDVFTQMTHSLQELAAAQGSFEVAFADAAEKMRRVIVNLKEAQACIPPCGGRPAFPLPRVLLQVQDVTVTRGRQAMFSCTVNFQLPKEEITYSWKFVGGLRTQDLTYFREIPRAQGNLARIRPAQPRHGGTFSCVIMHDQQPLARLYFFLNGAGGAARGRSCAGAGTPADVRVPVVTGPPPRGETELQVTFRDVLRWSPREAEMMEPWRPSLGELLARPEALTPSNQGLLAAVAAIASASVTILAWMFFRWYFSGY